MTPTKSEFDKAFYRLFEDGDYTAIANSNGHTPEYASQMYSPTGDRKSHLYRAFRDLRALRTVSIERGEKALALFIEFVTRGLEPEGLSVECESLKLKKEVDAWETVSMQNHSPAQIIEAVRNVEMQAERTLKAQIEQEDKPLVRRVMAEKVAEVHERRNGRG